MSRSMGNAVARSVARSATIGAGAAAIAALALAGCAAGSSVVTSTSASSVASGNPSGLPAGASSATTALPSAITGPFLWPFADAAAISAWQGTFTPGAADAWHTDAAQTAQRFAHDFLGYTELTKITSTDVQGTQAFVGVGSTGDGSTFTAGVVHLQRADTSSSTPWEVVGSKDSDLSISSTSFVTAAVASSSAPPTALTSPLKVTGVITGVDESLHVQLRTQAGAMVGEVKGISAGGTKQPWTASVPVTGAANGTVVVAVSTGGHLQTVEKFAVSAVNPAR